MAAQLRFPGTHPKFVRIELTHDDEMGWELVVFEAETRRYINAEQSASYSLLSGPEAAELVAAVLDGALGD